MPIKYAIRGELATPLTRVELAELQARGYSSNEGRHSYEDVPYVVADMDEQNGMYAVFSDNGMKLSDWLLMKKSDEVTKALILGRNKAGSPLTDSIGQTIKQGDYLFTHSHDYRNLELNQVVRNLKTKVVLEQLIGSGYSGGISTLRTRNPESFIKIPNETLEGDAGTMLFEKRFSVGETSIGQHDRYWDQYVPATESIARQEEKGCFAYFTEEGNHVTGWVSIRLTKAEQNEFEVKVHSQKKVMNEPPSPMTDAMGTLIGLGDVVFSNDNHYNDFLMCEIIGFTKDRVRLMAYETYRHSNHVRGKRIFTLNWPKNIVKFPITMI